MEVLALLVLTFISATIGTMTGFGTATIMTPVVHLFLPLPQTLLFVGVVHWFGDLWKIIFFKKGFNLKLALLFGVPGVVVSFLAARLPITIDQATLQRLLGAFFIVYAVFLLRLPKWKIPPTNQSAFLGGILSGFSAAVFGVGGAIRSAFLSAFDLPKTVFLFTSGIIGVLIDTSRLTQYTISGITLSAVMRTILLLCIPVSLFAAYLSKYFVDKIPQQSFRSVVLVALFLVGVWYLVT